MREILFRGKTIHGLNAWVYGYLFVYKDGAHTIGSDSKKYGFINDGVDPATIGQYTGLKDASGCKIFEGDIITIRGDPYLVYYRAPCFMFGPKFGIALIAEKGLVKNNNIKIISNIHDTPEMLA
jgi:hypothetical protein